MAYKQLTQDGIAFINHVCKGTGTKLINGINDYMPYTFTGSTTDSGPAMIRKIWYSNALIPPGNQNKITTGEELAASLIYWFNYYAKAFELDANVVAAQTYAESQYKIWIYVQYVNQNDWQSTASGVSQFLMSTLYYVAIKNAYGAFTADEIAKLTNGLCQPTTNNPNPTTITNEKSYVVAGSGTNRPNNVNITAWNNRPILHQNIIDNPGLIIKAQCAYLNYISGLCDDLTSSTLFCYSRGEKFARKTYLDTMNQCKLSTLNKKGTYINEGLNYVQKIFGILGDQYNQLGGRQGLGSGYKPIGQFFGYANEVRMFDPYDPSIPTQG